MGHECFADITYTLAPFTVDTVISDPGWSYLGGTITTDGTLGPINDGNVGVITGWNMSFIGPTDGMFSLYSGNSSVSYTSTPTNNDGAELLGASAPSEPGEESGSTKRNARQAALPRTPGRIKRKSSGLHGVREAARLDGDRIGDRQLFFCSLD